MKTNFLDLGRTISLMLWFKQYIMRSNRIHIFKMIWAVCVILINLLIVDWLVFCCHLLNLLNVIFFQYIHVFYRSCRRSQQHSTHIYTNTCTLARIWVKIWKPGTVIVMEHLTWRDCAWIMMNVYSSCVSCDQATEVSRNLCAKVDLFSDFVFSSFSWMAVAGRWSLLLVLKIISMKCDA